MYDPAIYAILGVAFLLVIALLYIAYLYREIVSRYNEVAKQNKTLQDNAQMEAQRTRDGAILESKRILHSATLSARKMITDTELVSKNAKFEFSKSLNEMLDAELEKVRETLSSATNNSIKASESISEDTKKFAETITLEFQKTLEGESTKVSNEFIKISKVAKDNIDKELQQYKKTKMANIDSLALQIAQDIAKQILGKTLTYEEHETLVLEALADAKLKHII